MAKEKDEQDPQTPPVVNPWDVLNRIAGALEDLKSAPRTPHSEELALRLTAALERVSESQVQGAQIIAAEHRRANRPSNQVVPNCSVFNRRGEMLPDDAEGPRKPPLKCIMLVPWLIEWESINREEAELLNLLERGEYTLTRVDRSKVRVTCTIDYKIDNVTPSRLLITHETAFNNDNFRLIPPLSDYIRQLLKQHPKPIRALADAVLSDEEEEALIEAGELSVSV